VGLAAVYVLVALSAVADASDVSEGVRSGAEEGLSPADRKWFLIVGFVNAYPKLESEDLINDLFEPFVRTLAPGFGDVATVGDLRNKNLLWVPYFGVGRVLSDRWAVSFHVSYSAGKVRTNVNARSRFILPLAVDFEIQRGAANFGLGLDYFPFRMPERKRYRGILEHLRAARPRLGASYSWTYATFNSKTKLGFKPLPNFLNIELSDSWFLPSLNLNAGLDIPVGPRSQLSIGGGYTFFWKQEFDFEGASYTLAWKYFFR